MSIANAILAFIKVATNLLMAITHPQRATSFPGLFLFELRKSPGNEVAQRGFSFHNQLFYKFLQLSF